MWVGIATRGMKKCLHRVCVHCLCADSLRISSMYCDVGYMFLFRTHRYLHLSSEMAMWVSPKVEGVSIGHSLASVNWANRTFWASKPLRVPLTPLQVDYMSSSDRVHCTCTDGHRIRRTSSQPQATLDHEIG